MLCFIAFRFRRTPVKSRAIGKLHNTNYQYITDMSLHIILHDLLFVFKLYSKSSTTRLRSLYIMFYLRCEYSTFSCARTLCYAMKRSIEICLL